MVKVLKWARPILARIMLRKALGRQPTEAEVKTRVKKLASNTHVALPTVTAIIAAFENGEEVRPPISSV
jgi:hypothetical protein